MTGRVMWCCIPLLYLFALTSVSAVQRLDSISDLKRINFGQFVPEHGLVLLHWFANIINIDYNNDLILTFNPRNGDYGSHRFGNIENLLDNLPWGEDYIIGNVDQTTSMPLPDYVVNPPFLSDRGNKDRIIIRVSGRRILQVFLTQHPNSGGRPWYDPDHTYQITTNLLRQIREFPMGGDYHTLQRLRNRFGSDADVSHIRLTWGRLACLVLFWKIVTQKKSLVYQSQSRRTDNWNNNESTWKRGSSYNYTPYTPQPSEDNPCLLFLLLLVLIAVVLFVCAVKLPHM